MVDFLMGHYTCRMFPPAIDIIPTSLALVYSNRKYTNKKLKSHHMNILSNPSSVFLCLMASHGKAEISVAHQREVEELPVGTCKYNVLLGNLPLHYWMFLPAIDRLPKWTYIGGGGERWVVGHCL